jgi:PII-like signaling protein
MKTPTQAVLMRIYTDEDALVGDRALVEIIVRRAREAHLAGATVLRGRMGFGHAARLHTHRPFDLRDNLPVVVELVDEEARLRAFLGRLDDLAEIGLITFEKVEVVRYRSPSPEQR